MDKGFYKLFIKIGFLEVFWVNFLVLRFKFISFYSLIEICYKLFENWLVVLLNKIRKIMFKNYLKKEFYIKNFKIINLYLNFNVLFIDVFMSKELIVNCKGLR